MHLFALFMMTSGRLMETWRGAEMERPASSQALVRKSPPMPQVGNHNQHPQTRICPHIVVEFKVHNKPCSCKQAGWKGPHGGGRT
jgi:hypothetical protein